MSRLKETYKNEIVDNLIKKFGYKNVMQVPKLDKIVINMGVGEAKDNSKALENAIKDLEIKYVLKNALTDKVNDREVYMKGIDHSYYYEGYTTFKAEEL